MFKMQNAFTLLKNATDIVKLTSTQVIAEDVKRKLNEAHRDLEYVFNKVGNMEWTLAEDLDKMWGVPEEDKMFIQQMFTEPVAKKEIEQEHLKQRSESQKPTLKIRPNMAPSFAELANLTFKVSDLRTMLN